ncbi:ATP-binding protein [Candidatus Nitrospira allomarina]|jgi:signal transduction histidine kinase|uniref:histidine kinase n=1 Tax=Candidatus Nitrospira allomarina TaxID=3020900 RepID=A0AA96GM01_9BACT|nr:ATP-binding protein [Candidatus Nitrospira allomarina]WNM60011.1 ATP-binding protein [Candidatus Nitrospira allomarina]
MRLNVKGKEALGVTVLTLVVVVGSTFLNLSQLSRVIVQETSEQVSLIKRQIFEYSKRVVLNAQSPDIHPVVLLATNQELKKFLEASVGYSPHLLYALIVDPQGKTLLHSEGAKTERPHPTRPKLEDLLSLGPIDRFTVLYQEGSIFDSALPITWENVPIGKVIVGIHTSLLRERMTSSLKTSVVFALVALPIAWLLTMGLATLTLRPIHALAEQMEQLRQGRFDVLTDLSRTDEFRELASQLQLLGQQLKSDRLNTLSEETHLQGVIEHLEDGVIVVDDQGKVLFLNQAMEFMVDIPGPHLPGHRLESLGESFTPLIRLVNQALAERKDLKAVPCSLPRKRENKSFYISVIYLSSSPRFHGAMILCRDIESMKTLQSLVRYAAQLTTLGQLTSGLAHEVKNPLNAMVIHLEILKEEAKGLNGDFQKSLEVLEGEVHRLDRVVLGFLKFMRPQELELSSVDVNQLLKRELSLLEREWGNKGIRFVLDCESDLPAISADPDLLSQVFLNIILNGCQAMEEQGGDIRIATSTHQDNEIRISISDQGPGIPPEMQEKIFQLYYTTKHHGSGLGLSLVYRFIQLHEGVIDVQTEMGKGTTFIIRLPRKI